MSQSLQATTYSCTTGQESSQSNKAVQLASTTLSPPSVGANKTVFNTTLSATLGALPGVNKATSESRRAVATVSAVSTNMSTIQHSQNTPQSLSDLNYPFDHNYLLLDS